MTDPHPAVRTAGTDASAKASTGTGTDAGTLAALDARYGRTGRSRRVLVFTVVGVLALAGLAWLLWAAFIASNPPVSSRMIGFKIESATTATATFQVDRSKSVEAQCRLQAKAADFSIVGELTVTVAPDSARQQTIDATVTTQRAATAVVLVGCTTADAHRPN
ncbi:DUF4307 domain-containing protein [Kribbella ginsengisoli]|uniref:DUF4307 domain-containing protein n=1 Tax=Kribbella ginsengisoli TaxID=363865 RepID=A0ABP6WGB9_9ACTN